MATGRVINTNYWWDTYIIELDPIEKLIFLYLLTNPQTNLLGVYEISVRQIAFDTGIDKDMVAKILARFGAENKIVYEQGWLILTNFLKHQRLNPSMKINVNKHFSVLAPWLQKRLQEVSPYFDQLQMELVQADDSVSPPSHHDATLKEKKLKETKRKETKLTQPTNVGSALPENVDMVAKKYYQVIKQYSLAVKNHNNVKSAIKKLKLESGGVEHAEVYLDFLLNNYQKIEFDHKPELNESLDVQSKRQQIINSVKRQATKQSAQRGFKLA